MSEEDFRFLDYSLDVATNVEGVSLGGSDSKEFACNVGDLGSIPGLGKSLGVRPGNPL